tara:strand:+ start:3524 stop:3865 length:342 start_codon:yes stop_codon:yes gene_type:complete
MPTYDYICEDCFHEINDIEQSIKDKPLVKCPNCNKYKLERVIYGGCHVSVRGDVTTIGQLADKNTKKHKSFINEEQSKNKKDNTLWHKGSATKTQINQMTPKQKQKYIMEGRQ